jgi:hypothetical protein
VTSLVLAVVTATFSLGIEATFDKTMSDPTAIGLPPFDVGADRDLLPEAEGRRILDSRPEVASYLSEYNSEGRVGDLYFDLYGYDGDLNNPRWAIREGRMPERAGEAALSTQLARDLGVSVGDRLAMEAFGPGVSAPPVGVDVQIVGRYLDLGEVPMAVKRETLPADVELTDYLIRLKPGTDSKAFANALIQESGGNLDLEILDESIGEVRGQFRSVLIGLNAVLFAIAGINLLSSLLLSARERRRDFAILKTIGFTPGQVAASVFAGSVLLAVVSLIVGLPAGLLVSRVVFDALTSAAGGDTGIGVLPNVLWLLPLIPGAIAIAALATALPSRRAAGVQIAEALRYE